MRIGFEFAFKREGRRLCYLNEDTRTAIKNLFSVVLDYGYGDSDYRLDWDLGDQLCNTDHKSCKAYRTAEKSLYNLGTLVKNKCLPYDTWEECLVNEIEHGSFYGHLKRWNEEGKPNISHYCLVFDMTKKIDVLLFNIAVAQSNPIVIPFE